MSKIKEVKEEQKQQIEKLQNGLYSVEKEGVVLLVTNNGTAIKESNHDEVEALKTMLPEAWDRLQIAAMVAIDNMIKKEARK